LRSITRNYFLVGVFLSLVATLFYFNPFLGKFFKGMDLALGVLAASVMINYGYKYYSEPKTKQREVSSHYLASTLMSLFGTLATVLVYFNPYNGEFYKGFFSGLGIVGALFTIYYGYKYYCEGKEMRGKEVSITEKTD